LNSCSKKVDGGRIGEKILVRFGDALIILLDVEPAAGSEERQGEEGDGEIPDCRSKAASRCCCLFFSRRNTADNVDGIKVQASSAGSFSAACCRSNCARYG
jgi:hypothetical protein